MSAEAARSFLESVAGYVEAPDADVPSQDKPVKLGTVDALYTSGNPAVLFDGETLMGVRTYPTLKPVRAGDRVVMLPQGHSYVVLGAVGSVFGADWPAGSLIEGVWAAAPTGFLLLDGSVLVRATYPQLFAVLGTTYNTGGETSLQFRLPDMRGRATVAKAAAGIFATIGAKVGTETETLTAAQIPAHTHANPAGGQFWVGGGTAIFAGGGTYSATLAAATAASTGGGGSHNNVQPSIVVNRAVKY